MAQIRWVLLPCQGSPSVAQRRTGVPSVRMLRGAEALQVFWGELWSCAAVGNSGIPCGLDFITLHEDASSVSQMYPWKTAGLPRARDQVWDQAPQLTGLQSTRWSDTEPAPRRFVACPWRGPARSVPGTRPGHAHLRSPAGRAALTCAPSAGTC